MHLMPWFVRLVIYGFFKNLEPFAKAFMLLIIHIQQVNTLYTIEQYFSKKKSHDLC